MKPLTKIYKQIEYGKILLEMAPFILILSRDIKESSKFLENIVKEHPKESPRIFAYLFKNKTWRGEEILRNKELIETIIKGKEFEIEKALNLN